MDDKETEIEDLNNVVKNFCVELNWRPFHNAKELAMGISQKQGNYLTILDLNLMMKLKNYLKMCQERIR